LKNESDTEDHTYESMMSIPLLPQYFFIS